MTFSQSRLLSSFLASVKIGFGFGVLIGVADVAAVVEVVVVVAVATAGVVDADDDAVEVSRVAKISAKIGSIVGPISSTAADLLTIRCWATLSPGNCIDSLPATRVSPEVWGRAFWTMTGTL